MDLRQLSALIAVAEGGSISAAARSLHTVQSNISSHLARLERELGVTLFDRTGGFLTEEGQAVVRRARRVQAELDALDADVAALRDEVTGTVRLGCIGTSARWLVPLVLEAVTAAHPKVHVIVVDATTTSLVPRLLADELDLAVVNLPVANPEVSTEPLFDEDRHPDRARRPSRSPDASASAFAELADHELLLEPSGTAFRDELDREAAAAGIELRAKAEVDGLRLIATLAFQGFGAAIVPATAAPDWLVGSWRRVPVDGLARRSVGLARRSRGLLPGAGPRPARGGPPGGGHRRGRHRGRPPRGVTARRPAESQPPHDPHRPRRVRPPGVALRRDHHGRRTRGGARAGDRRTAAGRAVGGRRPHLRRGRRARPRRRTAAPGCDRLERRRRARRGGRAARLGHGRPGAHAGARAACRCCSPPPARWCPGPPCCSAWPTTS